MTSFLTPNCRFPMGLRGWLTIGKKHAMIPALCGVPFHGTHHSQIGEHLSLWTLPG